MTVIASLDSHTLWEVSLGMGLVVIAVVIVLMVVLLSVITDIGRGVARLLDSAGEVGANTAWIGELPATAGVLDEIVTEATVHGTVLSEHGGGS
jgi:hypothetical protein